MDPAHSGDIEPQTQDKGLDAPTIQGGESNVVGDPCKESGSGNTYIEKDNTSIVTVDELNISSTILGSTLAANVPSSSDTLVPDIPPSEDEQSISYQGSSADTAITNTDLTSVTSESIGEIDRIQEEGPNYVEITPHFNYQKTNEKLPAEEKSEPSQSYQNNSETDSQDLSKSSIKAQISDKSVERKEIFGSSQTKSGNYDSTENIYKIPESNLNQQEILDNVSQEISESTKSASLYAETLLNEGVQGSHISYEVSRLPGNSGEITEMKIPLQSSEKESKEASIETNSMTESSQGRPKETDAPSEHPSVINSSSTALSEQSEDELRKGEESGKDEEMMEVDEVDEHVTSVDETQIDMAREESNDDQREEGEKTVAVPSLNLVVEDSESTDQKVNELVMEKEHPEKIKQIAGISQLQGISENAMEENAIQKEHSSDQISDVADEEKIMKDNALEKDIHLQDAMSTETEGDAGNSEEVCKGEQDEVHRTVENDDDSTNKSIITSESNLEDESDRTDDGVVKDKIGPLKKPEEDSSDAVLSGDQEGSASSESDGIDSQEKEAEGDKEKAEDDSKDGKEESKKSTPSKRKKKEDSQEDDSSQNTTNSSQRSEDLYHFPVENVFEYQWPQERGAEYFFVQEQISEFLGIKSFKRKYPELERRMLDIEERKFLKERGVVTEEQVTLGLNALKSEEVYDLMMRDYPEQYSRYARHMQEKHKQSIKNRHKEYGKAAIDATKMKAYLKKAMKQAAEYNATLMRERREERQYYLDLQTMLVHHPTNRMKKLSKERTNPGSYPVAVIPGQFQNYYKMYTPQELKYLPVNTAIYGPMATQRQTDIAPDTQPDDQSEEEDDFTVQKENTDPQQENQKNKEPSRPPSVSSIIPIPQLPPELESQPLEQDQPVIPVPQTSILLSCLEPEKVATPPLPVVPPYKPKEILDALCGLCLNDRFKNRKGEAEELVHCSQCDNSGHPSCLEMSAALVQTIKTYPWQCMECKTCTLCGDPTHEDKMMFCDECDRGYHTFCVGLQELPTGLWSCPSCIQPTAPQGTPVIPTPNLNIVLERPLTPQSGRSTPLKRGQSPATPGTDGAKPPPAKKKRGRKKAEVKTEQKKTDTKTEQKKTDAKTEQKKTDAKTEQKKTEAKSEQKKADVKTEQKKPELKTEQQA